MSVFTFHDAKIIIPKEVEKGKGLGLKLSSLAVMDVGGHLIAFDLCDGAALGRVAIAAGKARYALVFGMAARALSSSFF